MNYFVGVCFEFCFLKFADMATYQMILEHSECSHGQLKIFNNIVYLMRILSGGEHLTETKHN